MADIENKKLGRPRTKPEETPEETAIRIASNKARGNGRNNPLMTEAAVNTLPGENARYADLLLQLMSWPKVDRSDVGALEQRFTEYVRFCAENDLKIGNQVCYLALGITKDDVYDWENGRSQTQKHSDFIKKIKTFCAGNREMLMQDGKVWAPTGMFWQKNYDGLRDVQDITISPTNPLGAPPDISNVIEYRKQLEAGLADD